ncbi:MAG: hypothetical protein GX868_00850 [Actinobacteria bacterium]|nr:hypothetical protein [Actinomycetota bacterium]
MSVTGPLPDMGDYTQRQAAELARGATFTEWAAELSEVNEFRARWLEDGRLLDLGDVENIDALIREWLEQRQGAAGLWVGFPGDKVGYFEVLPELKSDVRRVMSTLNKALSWEEPDVVLFLLAGVMIVAPLIEVETRVTTVFGCRVESGPLDRVTLHVHPAATAEDVGHEYLKARSALTSAQRARYDDVRTSEAVARSVDRRSARWANSEMTKPFENAATFRAVVSKAKSRHLGALPTPHEFDRLQRQFKQSGVDWAARAMARAEANREISELEAQYEAQERAQNA